MSNRLSFFISVFVVALVLSVSFVQLFTESSSRRTNTSLGAQAADFSSGISVYAITPSDDAFFEGSTVQNTSVLKVRPGSQAVYLKFSVSGVSGPISSATLYLTQASDAGEGTITASLGEHSNWTEDTLSTSSSPNIVSRAGSLTDVFGNSKTYAIDVEGITGNGTYTLILGMEAGGNDVWFSSSEASAGAARPRLEVETGGVLLPFEAESASPRGSFTTGSVSTASSGSYLVQPTGVPNTTTAREDAGLTFNLLESGDYSLWARVYAPESSSDAFYVGFNGSLTRTFPSVHGEWTWLEVTRANLSAGTNRISMGPAESGLRVDLFAVVGDVPVSDDVLDEYFSLESGGTVTSQTTDEPSSPTPEPEPTPEEPAPSIVGHEAEDVASSSLLENSFVASNDSNASSGKYLVQPSTVKKSRSGEVVAQIPITLSETGDYSLWVRVNGPTKSSDAFYAGFSGTMKRVYPSIHGKYVWVEVMRTNLSSGNHTIGLGYGESGLKIDLFAVVEDETLTGTDLDAHFITDSEPDTPPPPPVSERFSVGDEVQTIDDLYVRATPGGEELGFQIKGSRGVVVGGPQYVESLDPLVSGTHWWQIDYADGVDGWSTESWLKNAPEIPRALGFEAEDANYQSVFTTGTENTASDQRYLVQLSTVANSTSTTEIAQLPVTIPSVGEYSLWVRVNAPNASSDAFYAGFNGVTKRIFPSTYGSYVWLEVTRENLSLSNNRISIAHGEAGLKIDLFALVEDDSLTSGDLDTYFSLVAGEPTPEPEPTPEEPAPSIVGHEAESASPRGSFVTESVSSASNGAYLVQPLAVSNTNIATEEATVSVSISESGDYSLWVRMYAPSTSSDAFYVGFNGALTRVFPSIHTEWVWKEVTRINLSSGTNRISIGSGESGLRIDLFAVVRDSSVTASDLDTFFNTEGGEDGTVTEPVPVPTDPISSDGSMSLRGDPTFSRSNLPSELRTLYDAFWASLNDSYPNLESASKSSNQYNYGRGLYQGVFMISTAFRQTGDLDLLDRMYELNKNMYDQLSDSWTSGTISPYYDSHIRKDLFSTDGYRNWRYSYNCTIGGTDRYCGRDNHRLEESLSHGMVAATMYALHLNRDLESPKGYNYGDMADKWLDYLRNDFEAKWRERYGREWPEMPYFTRYFSHTNAANIKTNYYVGLVLQDKGDSRASVYLAQADRMINELFDEPHIPSGSGAQAGGFVETSTPLGTAYIWAFGTPYGYGINSVSATPTTYARYFLGMAAELHFEGVARFDEDAMRKLSRTVAYFILDTDPPFSSSTLMLAADVVGGDGDGKKYVSGMQSTAYRGRNNANRYAISTFGVYGLWDTSGRINEITDAVHNAVSNRDRSVQLNGSRFITAFDEASSSN